MGTVRVSIRGMKEFRRELKRLDRKLGKELRKVWLRAAELVAERADAAAPARAKGVIKPRATQRAARIEITPKRGDELAVFLGQRRRSGWYRRARYRASTGRQFKPWVGNQWDPGETGGQPYHIGAAINAAVDDVVDVIGDGIDDLARRAFPD